MIGYIWSWDWDWIEKTMKSIMVCIITVLFEQEEFRFNYAIRGYQVYQYVWKTCNRRELHAKQEFNNPMDKFAVMVIKTNQRVCHLPHELL